MKDGEQRERCKGYLFKMQLLVFLLPLEVLFLLRRCEELVIENFIFCVESYFRYVIATLEVSLVLWRCQIIFNHC